MTQSCHIVSRNLFNIDAGNGLLDVLALETTKPLPDPVSIIINQIFWYSPEGSYTGNAQNINDHNSLKITPTCLWGQWVNCFLSKRKGGSDWSQVIPIKPCLVNINRAPIRATTNTLGMIKQPYSNHRKWVCCQHINDNLILLHMLHMSLQCFRHSNHHQLECLFNSSFRLPWQKTSPVLLALCEGNPPVTSGFPSLRASNVESGSMSRCLRDNPNLWPVLL